MRRWRGWATIGEIEDKRLVGVYENEAEDEDEDENENGAADNASTRSHLIPTYSRQGIICYGRIPPICGRHKELYRSSRHTLPLLLQPLITPSLALQEPSRPRPLYRLLEHRPVFLHLHRVGSIRLIFCVLWLHCGGEERRAGLCICLLWNTNRESATSLLLSHR